MANPTFELISVLRETATRLKGGVSYKKLLASIKIPYPMHHDLSTIYPIFAPQIFD